MKVFVCWSGRRSQEFALIVKDWLEHLLPGALDVALSVDIRKGTLWFNELDKALDGARLGIVCVTEEAQRSPWIHYESGVLSRALRESRHAEGQGAAEPQVFPLLFGLDGSRLTGPLSAYQSTTAHNQADMWRFVQAIARAASLPVEDIRPRFDAAWSGLLASLDSIKPAPIHDIFPEVEELFRGKSFHEPLDAQLSQNWLDRYNEIRQVHWQLRERLGQVKSACRAFVSDIFNELTAEVEGYARDASLLIGQPRYPIDDQGRVVFEQRGIERVCERRRGRILTLAAQLVDSRQAATFEHAFRFESAATTEERKKLIHREAASLRARPEARAPSDEERLAWLNSDWDLDHILFYELNRDRRLESFGVADAVRQATKEFERVRFHPVEPRRSLMALYYSLDCCRRLLRDSAADTRGQAQPDARMLVAEVLEFLGQPGRGVNAPIRGALHDIARAYGWADLAAQALHAGT